MQYDLNYAILSDEAYKVDRNKVNGPRRAGQLINNSELSQPYKILKTVDNQKNGLQAMAVAPIDSNGKVDTSEVVIAYAGTNFDDAKDRATDAQTVIGGEKDLERSPQHPAPGTKIAGQTVTAQHFAD